MLNGSTRPPGQYQMWIKNNQGRCYTIVTGFRARHHEARAAPQLCQSAHRHGNWVCPGQIEHGPGGIAHAREEAAGPTNRLPAGCGELNPYMHLAPAREDS
jgi:hypothetical protein